MIKLHLGCGKRDFGSDWIHIDGGDFPHVKYHNMTHLPFEDDSIDLIYASHLIAYWDREEIIPILSEWKRVLKSDGILRLATPDFKIMNALYMAGSIIFEDIAGPLYGKMNMNEKRIYHKTCYDLNSLSSVLENVGFKNVKRYNWKETEHADFDDHSQAYLVPKGDKENGILISLNVECRK